MLKMIATKLLSWILNDMRRIGLVFLIVPLGFWLLSTAWFNTGGSVSSRQNSGPPINAPEPCTPALAERDRILIRLGLSPRQYRDTAVLLVFHRGIKCVQCVSQLSLLGSQIEKFNELDIELIGICPEMCPEDILVKLRTSLGIVFPLVTDSSVELFRQFKCLGSENEILHGLFLIDKSGEVMWNSISEHAVMDMEEIFRHCKSIQKKDESP